MPGSFGELSMAPGRAKLSRGAGRKLINKVSSDYKRHSVGSDRGISLWRQFAAVQIVCFYGFINSLGSCAALELQNRYSIDSQLETLTSGGSSWTYTYNSLRKLDTETLSYQNRSFNLDWQYDTQGALSGVTYPNGETTTFAPNALGQASQVGSLINTTTWHPNGQNAGFNYGNGIVRTLTQTSRKLPDRLKDQGAALVFDEDLTYDQNANVTQITDQRDASLNRTLIYDAQDRLTSAQGVWGAGSMTYDGADNLKTQTIGAKNYTYSYTNEKLQTISDPNQTLISFGYDNRGNQTQKNGQALIWDQASRIGRINGKIPIRRPWKKVAQSKAQRSESTDWQHHAANLRQGRPTALRRTNRRKLSRSRRDLRQWL
jgi:YD repeat-containing protein